MSSPSAPSPPTLPVPPGGNGKARLRLPAVAQVACGELTQAEAARLLGLSVRQVRRLVARYRREGPSGLVHRLTGRPANNSVPKTIVGRAMELLATRYPGLGPSPAADRLAEHHGINLSRETLRRSMIEAGLWKPGRGRVAARPAVRPLPLQAPVYLALEVPDPGAWPSP